VVGLCVLGDESSSTTRRNVMVSNVSTNCPRKIQERNLYILLLCIVYEVTLQRVLQSLEGGVGEESVIG
jgi:hypothetical protein